MYAESLTAGAFGPTSVVLDFVRGTNAPDALGTEFSRRACV